MAHGPEPTGPATSAEALRAQLEQQAAELAQVRARLKSAQEQLIVQEKLASLGALTAGIAHEIKNPLNFVTNFAQLTAELVQELRDILAKSKAGSDPDLDAEAAGLLTNLEQNLRKIVEHGRRADSIVRGMLLQSRGGKGEPQPTDLNALVAEYVNLAYHGLRAQNNAFIVAVEMDLDPAVGSVPVIPGDLSRVILNIANNACYAAYRKKQSAGAAFQAKVTVRTKDLGDQVEIRIRDNGDGVPPAIRERIFEPFFTTKPAGSGTGLGLSISHDIIVKEHEGELRLDSAEGSHAEFIVTLPKNTR